MATASQLDPARGTTHIRLIILILALLLPLQRLMASQEDRATQIGKLLAAGQWEKVVDAVPESPSEPADLELDRGLALAQLQRWDEARSTFRAGAVGHPGDARFRVELAGLAYREKNYAEAKRQLRAALQLEPEDAYAANLLASSYYLEGNLEAALEYWNRGDRPRVMDLTFDPQPRLNPLLLDRTFNFSPGSTLTREQFLATQARLDALGIFPRNRLQLQARQDGTFDLELHAAAAHGWGISNPRGLVSVLRGLPFETVYPHFYNFGGSGLNWLSTFRWDDQKRLVHSEIAAPLERNPALRFRAYVDARNENWNLSGTLQPSALTASGVNLEKLATGAEFRVLEGGRWQWDAGAEYSYRRFRALSGVPVQASSFFTDGSSVAIRSGLRRSLIRFPERRFHLDGTASAELGTFLRGALGRYARLRGNVSADWLPQAQGEDYEFQSAFSAGATLGRVPFDELFMLGFDRDNDLLLRGHPDLRDGRKGEAPLGRNYVLLNTELDKIIYRNGIFALKAGPLVDTGRIYDSSGFFGSPKWLWDAGLQTKIRILGSFQLALGYGKDLRSGRNSFFAGVSR